MTDPHSRARALRWSLLAALGLTPFTACQPKYGPNRRPNCENERELLPGQNTGFLRCGGTGTENDSGSYVHRAVARSCTSALPRTGEGGAGGGAATNDDPSPEDECQVDTDCPGPHGYCDEPHTYFENFLVCKRGCLEDADCKSDELCECGEFIGVCVPSTCKTDADCSGDARCASVDLHQCDSHPQRSYACESKADACMTNSDCGEGSCAISEEGSRFCPGSADCTDVGRPFLIEFSARTAALVDRDDWLAALEAVNLDGMNAAERARWAAHWAKLGLLEHASIAAFARFALQLTSLGAPSELVRLTHAAQDDETKHARLCFALASQYAGRAVGPGPLVLRGALDDLSPEGILWAAVLEGCIGETRAALEAQQQAAICDDPVVRNVLETIAGDEARHAELAWRFVHWLLEEHPELGATFDRAIHEAGLRVAGGAPSPVEHRAWVEVIRPTASGLRQGIAFG